MIMRALVLFYLFLCSAFLLNAQDTLSIKPGNNSQMKVVDLGSSEASKSSGDLFTQGQKDAAINYKGYKTSGTAVLVTTAIPGYGILLGGLPIILADSRMPLDENLGYPDSTLMKNRTYATGYRDYANEIKKKKVLKNYFTGIPIYIVSSGIFMALVFNKGSVMF
jgi:hypothetical protein